MKWVARAVILAACAGSVQAAETVKFYDSDSNLNNHDAFVADLGANGYNNPVGDFMTLCVELVENFSYGIEYEFLVSTNVRDNGGNEIRSLTSLQGSRVAWIYKTFRTGGEAAIRSLDGSFGAFTDSQIRELMQRYTWDRFAYPDSDNFSNATFTETMFNVLRDAADAGGAMAGQLFGVQVMNIYAKGHVGDDDFGGQDQLIIVPLPSASGLALAGCLGAVAVRRRRG